MLQVDYCWDTGPRGAGGQGQALSRRISESHSSDIASHSTDIRVSFVEYRVSFVGYRVSFVGYRVMFLGGVGARLDP